MRETLERREALDFLSRTAAHNADPAHNEVSRGQERNHAKDDDRTHAMEREFVKIIPPPTGGLHEYRGTRIRDIDASFDARRLLQQFLFTHGALVGFRRTIGGVLLSRRWQGASRRDEYQRDAYQRDECRRDERQYGENALTARALQANHGAMPS